MSWDKLSMADRAKYIKSGVSNGITDLSVIRDTYNKFAEGGQVQRNDIDGTPATTDEYVGNLAGLTVTPRGNYTNYTGNETVPPSLNDYINSKIDETRISAANSMARVKMPVVPVVPNKVGRGFLRVFGDWYDDKDAIFLFGREKKAQTCINTVTSQYPHSVSGNKTFKRSPSTYGFVHTDNPRVGDIIQFSHDNGVPFHSGMVTAKRHGVELDSWSNGGVTPKDIIIDRNLRDSLGKNPNFEYFTYIGTEGDRANWEKEYNEKYSRRRSYGGLVHRLI